MKSVILSTIITLALASSALALDPSKFKNAWDQDFAPVSADEIVAPTPTLYREFGTETKAKWTAPLLAYAPFGVCLQRNDTEEGQPCARAVNFIAPSTLGAKTPEQVEEIALSLTDYNPTFIQPDDTPECKIWAHSKITGFFCAQIGKK